MSVGQSGFRRIKRPMQIAAIAAVGLLSCRAALAADIKQPDCVALEEWASTIDGKDRWQPVEGNRGWIPRAFQAPAFEALFGAPALEWASEDAEAVAARLFDCGKQAGAARRMAARKLLYGARGYVQGNLRGILIARDRLAARAKRDAEREVERQQQEAERAKQEAERQQQQAAEARARAEQQQQQQDAAIAEALDALLQESDSTELLRRLAMLQSVDFNDPQSYGRVYGQVGNAGRTLMYNLRNQGSDMSDPRVAPKLEARATVLRNEIVSDYGSRIDALNNSTESLRFLARWRQEVIQQLAPLVGRDAASGVLEKIAAKDQEIRAGIFARAKQLIDQADANSPGDEAELVLIDKIVVNSAKAGLTPQQMAAVRQHAAARQQVLAGRLLEAARAELDNYPETLDGLDRLRRDLYGAGRGPLARAEKAAFDAYRTAARARLTEIAEAAFPQFEQGLADLPVSAEGLKGTEATLVSEAGFDAVAEPVRRRYIAAVGRRRAEIGQALEAKAAERRRAAVEAGGDPDLVGFRFVDSDHVSQIEFRDEKLVIMNFMGIRGAGDYQVSAGDVIVRGPNGTLVLSRSGSGEATKLSGMGLTFQRARD